MLVFFFIVPLFGVVILGMLWKRTTPAGGFWGLLIGTISSIGMWIWTQTNPKALAIIAFSADAKPMANDMFRALWSFLICVIVTLVVTAMTKPKPDSELTGLVYGCTELPSSGHLPLVQRPVFWGTAVLVVLVLLQWKFW